MRGAASGRCRALELELQAEVDKFVCCCCWSRAARHRRCAGALYGGVSFADDLDDDERERYRTANHEASRYAGALERRFAARTGALLAELRRFYRLGLADKLSHIARELVTRSDEPDVVDEARAADEGGDGHHRGRGRRRVDRRQRRRRRRSSR